MWMSARSDYPEIEHSTKKVWGRCDEGPSSYAIIDSTGLGTRQIISSCCQSCSKPRRDLHRHIYLSSTRALPRFPLSSLRSGLRGYNAIVCSGPCSSLADDFLPTAIGQVTLTSLPACSARHMSSDPIMRFPTSDENRPPVGSVPARGNDEPLTGGKRREAPDDFLGVIRAVLNIGVFGPFSRFPPILHFSFFFPFCSSSPIKAPKLFLEIWSRNTVLVGKKVHFLKLKMDEGEKRQKGKGVGEVHIERPWKANIFVWSSFISVPPRLFFGLSVFGRTPRGWFVNFYSTFRTNGRHPRLCAEWTVVPPSAFASPQNDRRQAADCQLSTAPKTAEIRQRAEEPTRFPLLCGTPSPLYLRQGAAAAVRAIAALNSDKKSKKEK